MQKYEQLLDTKLTTRCGTVQSPGLPVILFVDVEHLGADHSKNKHESEKEENASHLFLTLK
jgi:hypothetical protein